MLVGDNPASQVYVRNKQNACEQVGFQSELLRLPAETSKDELLELIDKLNARDDVDGILVQLPLPQQIDGDKITERMAVSTDNAWSVPGEKPPPVGKPGQVPPQLSKEMESGMWDVSDVEGRMAKEFKNKYNLN